MARFNGNSDLKPVLQIWNSQAEQREWWQIMSISILCGALSSAILWIETLLLGGWLGLLYLVDILLDNEVCIAQGLFYMSTKYFTAL